MVKVKKETLCLNETKGFLSTKIVGYSERSEESVIRSSAVTDSVVVISLSERQ